MKACKFAVIGLLAVLACSPAMAQRAQANIGDTVAVSISVTDLNQNPTTIPADALWNIRSNPDSSITWLKQSGVGDPGVVRGLITGPGNQVGYARIYFSLSDPASPAKYFVVPTVDVTILAANQPTPVATVVQPTPTVSAGLPAGAKLTLTVEKAK